MAWFSSSVCWSISFLREAIAAIPDTIAATGEVIYDARNTIYRAHIGGVDLTVKSFHVPAPPNRFVYTFLRPGKARRSYDNAMRLQALSIGTPEPIAYMEEYRGGLIARSYYVCRMFEGQNIRHWETDVDDYKSMLRAFAAEHGLTKLHVPDDGQELSFF